MEGGGRDLPPYGYADAGRLVASADLISNADWTRYRQPNAVESPGVQPHKVGTTWRDGINRLLAEESTDYVRLADEQSAEIALQFPAGRGVRRGGRPLARDQRHRPRFEVR